MKPDQIADVFLKKNAMIVAPAGHGKTEMIVDMVGKGSGRQLLLTHTNAGIDAMRKRLKKRRVSSDKFSIMTIASFCQRWCYAFPNSSRIDVNREISHEQYYNDLYRGASRLFEHKWARDILERTYQSVIVDEYQDCLIIQHHVFEAINQSISVYAFGDPLQAIFYWVRNIPLARWKDIKFEKIEMETEPWRWKNTNIELGEYIRDIRKKLLPATVGYTVEVPTVSYGNSIVQISPDTMDDYGFAYNLLKNYNTTLYITHWSKEQLGLCVKTNGLFQYDEPINIKELSQVAEGLDSDDGIERAKTLLWLVQQCATHVKDEIETYICKIFEGNSDFSRIRKNAEFAPLITSVIEYKSYSDELKVLKWLRNNPKIKLYRKELFLEVERALRTAIDKDCSVSESAQQIRFDPMLSKRYSGFQMLSSRTVLSKGLEFDCVIIDLKDNMVATDYYVALTRARYKVYLVTNKDTKQLAPLT